MNYLMHNLAAFEITLCLYGGAEAETGITHSLLHYLFETLKGACTDKENIGSVDLDKLLLRMLSSALGRYIGNSTLKNFQKCLLNTLTANITGNRGAFALSADLIDFIHIYDTLFSSLYIKIRRLNESEKNILYILTYISRLGKCSSVSDSKGNIEYSRKSLCKHSLTYTCGTEHKNITLSYLYGTVLT